MSGTAQAGSDADRTSLAWSRTLIGFAAVTGLIGVRAALIDAPLWAIIPILVVSVCLLLANGLATSRSLRRARSDVTAGRRDVKVFPGLVAAAATTMLAAASLCVLFIGAPPA